MYLGTRSLSALWHFQHGYKCALKAYSLESEEHLGPPHEFVDWVAYRLHFSDSVRGWKNMILDRTRDESLALDRFYELLDEFENRQQRVVVKCTHLEYKGEFYSYKLDGTKQILDRPSAVLLVTYTDDPGFFVMPNNPSAGSQVERLYFSFQDLDFHFDAKGEHVEIVDNEIYSRLLNEARVKTN